MRNQLLPKLNARYWTALYANRSKVTEGLYMPKQEHSHTPGMEALFKQLQEENPKASEKELSKLFVDAIRDDPNLITEAVAWFIKRNYPREKPEVIPEGWLWSEKKRVLYRKPNPPCPVFHLGAFYASAKK